MNSPNRITRYQYLAEQIKLQIKQSIWRAGEKVPSIRETSRTYSVSSSTTLQAYQLLESEGWLIAKPQSGYFVTSILDRQHEIELEDGTRPSFDDELYQFLSFNNQATVAFGSALPDPNMFPLQLLNRHMASSGRQASPNMIVSDMPPGNPELRRLIAQRYLAKGVNISPEDIVITSGAMEGLNLSLGVVTKPNDRLVIESPAFYGAIQAATRHGLESVEMRVDPIEGVDIDHLEQLVIGRKPNALWIMPHFQNPTGYCLSDEVKEAIVVLANQYDFFVIEDDVYSDLAFSGELLKPLKFWDTQDRVLLCGSFSKSLAPGYRVGWVISRKFGEQIQKQQLISTLSCSSPIQQGIAHYLKYEGVDNHLRKLKRELKARLDKYSEFLKRHLCDDCELFEPNGGYFLWLKLPVGVSGYGLYQALRRENVSLAYGELFSNQDVYANHIRINVSIEWCDEVEAALLALIKQINSNC